MDEVKTNGKDLSDAKDKNMDEKQEETKIEMPNGNTEHVDKSDKVVEDTIDTDNDEANRSSSPLVFDPDDNERYGDLTKYNDEKPPQDHMKGETVKDNDVL